MKLNILNPEKALQFLLVAGSNKERSLLMRA